MIQGELIERHSNSIYRLVEENMLGPELQNREFDKYTSLINEEEKEFVEAFLDAYPPHSFDEYSQLIKKYHELAQSIDFELTVFVGLFEMRRRNLSEQMIHMANRLKQDLLKRMVTDYQQKVKA